MRMTGKQNSYFKLLSEVKNRIRTAQTRAMSSVNREMILLYWDVGQLLIERQRSEGWGAAVIPRLARDIRNELPEVKGFSERNIGYMIRFVREYGAPPILQQSVAKLPEPKLVGKKTPHALQSYSSVARNVTDLVTCIPWGHNVLLMEKVKELSVRIWYMAQDLENGWSRDILYMMIEGNAHKRGGKAVTNFKARLPAPHSDMAQQALKDPYIFDFLTLEEPFRERELETSLVHHLEKFLIELGQGFSFVGRQYHLDIGDQDFYIDLLFYHLKLRCFIVVELKKGPFKPEYAGKMNFYLNVVDDQLKHVGDNPSIGLILCQDKRHVLAEYALRDMKKPIGVAQWKTRMVKSLPKELKGSLPTIEELEDELEHGK